jgi:hypothetical protein
MLLENAATSGQGHDVADSNALESQNPRGGFMPKTRSDETAASCALMALGLWAIFAIGWVSFLVWVIYTLVTWLTSK